MKQYITKRTERAKEAKTEKRDEKGAIIQADVIKIGVDVGLRKYAYCRQVDGALQEPPHVCTPEGFFTYALKQKRMGKRVVVCYEAGFLGFELARNLIGQGIECLVMAPIKLDEGNKRVETDSLNARDIVSRLDRYLAGNTRALTICRIPKREEELARQQTRQRQQLLDQRKALEAQGRSLMWQFDCRVMGRWWSGMVWVKRVMKLEAEIVSSLKRLRAVILEINVQMKELEDQLKEQAKAVIPPQLEKLPVGMGWLSVLIVLREWMDPGRFKNRRQVGCFAGLVPSEASTGESFRQGGITKVGNPTLRATLVEMAWRMVRYQPGCRAIRSRLTILKESKAGPRARKKAIVAAARVLGIDLWRLATGQTTVEKLGFVV